MSIFIEFSSIKQMNIHLPVCYRSIVNIQAVTIPSLSAHRITELNSKAVLD